MSSSRLFEVTPQLLSESNRLYVAGDIHGVYHVFRKIRDLFDVERDVLIFLGDYADRGAKGMEVIEGIRDLMDEYPNRVIPLKGNHEDYTSEGKPRFMPASLPREARRKKGGWSPYFSDHLKPFLNRLYLSALIPGETLFVHGGISSRISGLDDLRSPTPKLEQDILWSDPAEVRGERPNRRGVGVEFGEKVTEEVCQKLNVKRVVRSHQPRKARKAPLLDHGGKIITINSTTVYGGMPFILDLPTENLSPAFENLEEHTLTLK
ncbi:MAG: metallophosphoesterase family protein [Thermoproteota archaeon]